MQQALTSLVINGRIARLTIDNPPFNILSLKLRQGMMQHLIELQQNPDVSVLIIEAAGEKAFSPGFDLREFPNDEAGGLQMIRFAQHVLNIIFNLPQITIVKLQGHVLGGGACMMLACDFRIAAEDARIGMPEIKVGAFSAGGGTHMLARQMSFAKAKELVILGEPIAAVEAERFGLLNKVVPRSRLDETVNELAEKLARLSRPALRAAKRSVNSTLTSPFEAGQTVEAEGMAGLFRSSDLEEGVSAFKAKKAPNFTAV